MTEVYPNDPIDLAQPNSLTIDDLNAEQKKAVETTEGPVLVLAGAGTGKTRVLTSRIAYILAQRRAQPWQILCVTFTNKAAREMRERTHKLIGPMAEGLRFLGTFHAIAAQMLRRHAALVGLTSTFTILDDDDQVRLLKTIMEDDGVDIKKHTPKSFCFYLDQWKNQALSPQKLAQNPKALGACDLSPAQALRLYHTYQERLVGLNACDFGDLLLHMITILTDHPDLSLSYHQRFLYVLVDEYQDTNIAQYLWLRLLTPPSRNLCCVGDDDQSIYGWRGAEIDNILRFEHDFPGAQLIRLEQNYRSTDHILKTASSLIAHNQGRLGKSLWTHDTSSQKVEIHGLWDGASEARFIAEDIERLQKKGNSFSDMAILVRASFQMRAFEEALVRAAIPYIVVGGPRFFERAEIRDAIAYLRLIAQPSDDLAFSRIINVPKRGIGDASVQNLFQASRLMQKPVLATISELIGTNELSARLKTSLEGFVRHITHWQEQLKLLKPEALLDVVLTQCGYKDMLRADKLTGASRLDNLKELGDAMAGFEDIYAFLEHVALVMDIEKDHGQNAVRLMTLHAAKGLEFPVVFLPGWEEGLFPSPRSVDEQGQRGLEEERRLAYVGITRARKIAKISYAANRQIYGRWMSQLPSRFLDGLAPEHIQSVSVTGYHLSQEPTVTSRFDKAGDSTQNNASTSPAWQGSKPHRASSPAPTPTKGFRIGERVFHIKFGYGEVLTVDGNKLSVRFDHSGEKKVIDQFLDKANGV